jgi:hypothetical protein
VVICTVCIFVKVLQFSQIFISKVTTSTLELQLLGSECINNHKLLHFLLVIFFVTASFHLHPRIIMFSKLIKFPTTFLQLKADINISATIGICVRLAIYIERRLQLFHKLLCIQHGIFPSRLLPK